MTMPKTKKEIINLMESYRFAKTIAFICAIGMIYCIGTMCKVGSEYEDKIAESRERIVALETEMRIVINAKEVRKGDRISKGNYEVYDINGNEFLCNTTTGECYKANIYAYKQITKPIKDR